MRSTSGKTALTNLPRLSPHRSLRAQIIHHLFKGGGHLQTLMFEAVTPPALALIVSSNSAVVELSSRLDRKALRATEADGDRQLGGRDGSPLADGGLQRLARVTQARRTRDSRRRRHLLARRRRRQSVWRRRWESLVPLRIVLLIDYQKILTNGGEHYILIFSITERGARKQNARATQWLPRHQKILQN